MATFLGIDPGWANCGFAVVDGTRLRQAWTWRPRTRTWVDRCRELGRYMDRLLDELGEGVRVGLETVQWHGRRTGLIRLAITVGVLWGVAVARRVAEVKLYPPALVKRLGLPRGWRAVDEHARDATVVACLTAGRTLPSPGGRRRRAGSARCSGRWWRRAAATHGRARRRRGGGCATTAARGCVGWSVERRSGDGGRGRDGGPPDGHRLPGVRVRRDAVAVRGRRRARRDRAGVVRV
ncbi:MAG: hypothetical protein QN120_05030 [Armatimonadota bacterium]|nr:hypothetical protein [Armatimonadota bacterium]